MRNPRFLGVYSRVQPGIKLTRSKKQFFFVWGVSNDVFAIQALNNAFVPTGHPILMPQDKFKTGFKLEPGILAAPVTTPDLRYLQTQNRRKVSTTSQTNINNFDNISLEDLEKARKAKQVETDLRGNFDKALRALSKSKDRRGALAALEQIAETTEGIVPAHKHMFRDFGVTLRKKSLMEIALRCAQRVLELAPRDDHAHFNIARILNMMNMNREAAAHIQRAMELDANEPVYGKFLNYIQNAQK